MKRIRQKIKKSRIVKNLLLITLGSFIYAFAFEWLFVPYTRSPLNGCLFQTTSSWEDLQVSHRRSTGFFQPCLSVSRSL